MLDQIRTMPKETDTGREQMLLFLCCALGVGWGLLSGRLALPLEFWMGPALFLLVLMAVLSERPFYAGVNTMAFFICLFVNGHVYSTLVPGGYEMLQETLLRLLWVVGATALGTVLWAAKGETKPAMVIAGLAAGLELPLIWLSLQKGWFFPVLDLGLLLTLLLLLQKTWARRLTTAVFALLSWVLYLFLVLAFRL